MIGGPHMIDPAHKKQVQKCKNAKFLRTLFIYPCISVLYGKRRLTGKPMA